MNVRSFKHFLIALVMPVLAYAQDGQPDLSFAIGTGFNGTVKSVVEQPDGKILVAGNFSSYNGSPVGKIARLNANGSLDNTFSIAGTGINQEVWSIILQPDGKIIAGGDFTNTTPNVGNYIARLNPGGSIDPTFNTGTGFNSTVFSLAFEGGKVLAGGYFTLFNGTSKKYINRLNPDGTQDVTFNPGTGFDAYLYKVVSQPDGKILAAGAFTSYNGTSRNYIARLNNNGSVDASFVTTGTGFNASLHTLALQPDGNIIAGGYFTSYNGSTCNNVARLTATGSLDATFTSGTGFNSTVHSLYLQPDGKIIAGGEFTSYNGTSRNGILRVNANGSIDPTFDPGTGLSGGTVTAYDIAGTAGSAVIIGGNFNSYNSISHNKIARINTAGCITPTIGISATPSSFCLGGSTTLSASGAATYTFMPGNISGVSSVTFSPSANTTYTVTGAIGTCLSTSTIAITVSQIPTPAGAISGNTLVASGSLQTYSVSPVADATGYMWFLPSGWTGSSVTNTISVTTNTNAGTIAVSTQNACGSGIPSSLSVSIIGCSGPSQPSAISGNTTPAAGASEQYSVSPVAGATSYSWTLPAGYSGSSATNSISVIIGQAPGQIQVSAVNACGLGAASAINVNPVSSATVTPVTNHDWVWAKSTGEQYASNYVMDITTDNSGNTYVTGWFNSSTIKFGSITLTRSSTGNDIYIAKYDPNGNVLWAKSAAGSYSESWAIATDLSDNVYIAGTFKSATLSFGSVTLSRTGSGGSNLFIAKYDSNGNVVWAQDVDYTTYIWLYGIDTDSQGNVFITGSFGSQPITFGSTTLPYTSNTNPFLVKYNAAGNVVWARAAQNSTYANWSTAVTTDANDNVYITGNYRSNAANPFGFGSYTLPNTNLNGDMFVVKYDNNGNVLWAKSATGNTGYSGGDYPQDITTDHNGNVIITGELRSSSINFGNSSLTSFNTNHTTDVFVVKYDAAGNDVWARKAGGLTPDGGERVTCDNLNNVYVAGYFESKPAAFGNYTITKLSAYSSPVFIVKYSDSGSEQWVKYVEKTDAFSGNMPSNGIKADYAGNVYVAGSASDGAVFGNTTLTLGGVFLAKLGDTQVGINELNKGKQQQLVYPNPTTGLLHIISDGLTKHYSVSVYNMQAEAVLESAQVPGYIDLSGLARGMYILKITDEKGVATQKIILE